MIVSASPQAYSPRPRGGNALPGCGFEVVPDYGGQAVERTFEGCAADDRAAASSRDSPGVTSPVGNCRDSEPSATLRRTAGPRASKIAKPCQSGRGDRI